LGRCKLRDVDRCSDGGEADGDAEECAGDEERGDVWRCGCEDGPEDEEGCAPDERGAAADAVGDDAAEERARHGADENDADDSLFHASREGEGGADEDECGGDDAHVEAIEDATEACDSGDLDQKCGVDVGLGGGYRVRQIVTSVE